MNRRVLCWSVVVSPDRGEHIKQPQATVRGHSGTVADYANPEHLVDGLGLRMQYTETEPTA